MPSKRLTFDELLAKARYRDEVFAQVRRPPSPIEEAAPKERRVKQSQRTGMNALETRFFALLCATYPDVKIESQSKQYRYANGSQYRPDFTAIIAGVETCWEVKGPYSFRGAYERLKGAASAFPQIVWWLAWEENGAWKQQKILP